ncbi:SNF-related serine/threonine-protein kinase [Pseudolycoriella hygida]|uniref:SNF-related serine/threonine-protein kinase n=1 Tax=Pseudolycoriella hygida TaxID=35572 RepID=A0A9Q0S6G8_9DIPT|nr:SNF-related serine/threonine-protein kinase [Pseudolycoriella hygida]
MQVFTSAFFFIGKMTATGNSHRIGVYDGKIAGLYDLEETLGSGHFAVVKLARHVFTGEKVAVKVIDKTKLDEVSKAHLFQEVRCMKLVQHPNVVRLYEVIDTQTKLYLILELGDGGDLYDYIMKHEGGLQESLAKEYFRQIVRAISYCHELHVVHRDLKPENVVFFEKLGVVKLTDFGFSNKFCDGQKLETSCGSLAYSAPEILLGDSYDAPAVDIWSLGVILYMLVAGHAPFQEANDSETLTMIMDCKYTMPPHISPECTNLISTMLVVAPDKRSTLKQIAKHPWLTTDDKDRVPEYLPLVSREQVSEEDHNTIIQKMVNGNIAAKEEIIDALDKNEYNHITATYFLLAERKLRAQRQEQAQKKRPELSLPVSISRLMPKSNDNENKQDQVDYMLQPNVGHLCVPRTPGVDGSQTNRIRKCSIVQEEIDDEEEEVDEENVSFNRRGSRSEGRINITIQDRIAENDRLKKDATNPSKGCFDGLSGVTLVSSDKDPKERLGISRRPGDFRPRTADVTRILTCKTVQSERSHSVDPVDVEIEFDDNTSSTKFLTDSSTITIPFNSQTFTPVPVPKYKTMPSPTRANTILPGANSLNEIFEEGTDVGSSDCSSAANTPQPVTRQTHYLSTRSQSQTTQRRSKFKNRTASCSSSDASDDEENRKKRAHKMVESTTNPIQLQRRDSHDDSSDSQDPGSNAAGTSQSANIVQHTNVVDNNAATGKDQNSHRHTGNTSNGGRQKSGQSVGFKRHRAGRRRAGETRLRESQSLNRITEVQESEIPLSSTHSTQPIQSKATNDKVNGSVGNNRKGFSARLLSFGFRKNDNNTDSSPITQQTSDEEVEMALGVELAKALKVTESKNSSATKKLKMIGRYFQVHKKLCIPIPGIFQRGRLYKAQSCGSIVRDKVHQPHIQTTNTDRHSTIFTDKSRILRNCLGSRILGSDSDINQNNGQQQSNVLLALNNTTKKKTTKGCIARSSSPLHHHITDSSLCSSQC